MSFFDLYRPFIEATQRKQEIEKNESQSILRDPNPEYQQMTIFDLMNKAANEDVSTSDIDDIIRVLQDKKRAIEEEERCKREEEKRKIQEERRRQKEEQKRLAQIEKEHLEAEEKARAEAHVAEVTSMELPMNWENLFDSDPITADVHVDSIPDAFVKCLNTFGRVDIEYIASMCYL